LDCKRPGQLARNSRISGIDVAICRESLSGYTHLHQVDCDHLGRQRRFHLISWADIVDESQGKIQFGFARLPLLVVYVIANPTETGELIEESQS